MAKGNKDSVPDRKRKDIVNRLRTIKGHIAGIEKMVEDSQRCDDILAQLMAARASIHKVGILVLENHAHECLTRPDENGEIDLERIEESFGMILRFVK